MSDSNNDPYIYWVEPKERGIIDLQEFKVPKSLKKIIKKNNYEIKINSRFEDVIKLCAKNRYRNTSWINNQIIENYTKLNKLGFAKSVEYYFNKKLVGGLYGIILGKIFCGESMFSLVPNASKISLVYLAVLLKENGFKFIDTQFYSDHLKQFGTKKISKKDYQNILKKNFKKKNIIFRDSLKKILKSYF
tara:strand:+ start:1246 stop:1815 length:570 start_codon:yes stop_codon:yes gene_type:complete